MPKRGAAISTTRRSLSLGLPVMRACTGAAKPSAPMSAGTSWTRPSVMKIAPAIRAGGTSAGVALSAPNKRVPSVSPSAWPASITRVSMPGMRCSRWVTAARAASVWAARSPKPWLGLLSTTTTATEVRGSRSSRVSDGLASASTMSASAPLRTRAPRLRDSTNSAAMTAATAAAAQTNSTGTRGEKLMPNTTLKFPTLVSFGCRVGKATGSDLGRPDDRLRVPTAPASCIGAARKSAPLPTLQVLLLPQPFEKRRNMDLIGLVVAGQGVHHDVDAGAESEFALARLAGHQRQHRLAVWSRRPGPGQIVRRDDDGGYAVAAARRAFGIFVFVLIGALQRLHPELARGEATRKVAQQEERLGQHVVARHRLQFRNIERRQNRAQLDHAGAARLAARTGRRQHGIAGIEQHCAALLHVAVDARQGLGRRLLSAGHDRPIDDREERELVVLQIDADRIASLERGALGQEGGEARKACFADQIGLAVARHHVGEVCFEGRSRCELVGRSVGGVQLAARGERKPDTGRNQQAGGEATTRHQPMDAAGKPE